jgi:hypothetical protein
VFGESGEVVKHGIGDAGSERADREEEAVTMRGHFVVDAEWPETCEVRSFAKEFGVGNADGVGEAETVNMLEVFVLCGSDARDGLAEFVGAWRLVGGEGDEGSMKAEDVDGCRSS